MPRETFVEWGGVQPPQGWDFIDLCIGGRPVATAALMGSEIHFAISPPWRRRLIQRERTREFLRPLIDRVGFLTTRSPRLGDEFLTRIGFVHTWSDGEMHHYMLADLPFQKETSPCR